MAKIKDGKLSGKLGNLVAYTRDGENLWRKAPTRTAPPTKKELANQHIFGLVQNWVTPLNPFLKRGFRKYSQKVYGANAAKSLIHKHALHRDGFNSYVDASLVQVSSGKVKLPEGLQAALNVEGKLIFSWDPGTEHASPRDRIIMLAYNLEEKHADYDLSGAKRHEGSSVLPLLGPAGKFYLYAAFVSEDQEDQSDSQYLGELEI